MSAAETTHHLDVVVSLDERKAAILDTLEGAALGVGDELLAAKRDYPGAFMRWVEAELPFSIDKAERLMAVTRAFATVDDEVRYALPKAWTVLYELSRLPIDVVEHAVREGAITPTLTREKARELVTGETEPPPHAVRPGTPGPKPGFNPNPMLRADSLAGELVRQPRGDLSPEMETILADWLGTQPKET